MFHSLNLSILVDMMSYSLKVRSAWYLHVIERRYKIWWNNKSYINTHIKTFAMSFLLHILYINFSTLQKKKKIEVYNEKSCSIIINALWIQISQISPSSRRKTTLRMCRHSVIWEFNIALMTKHETERWKHFYLWSKGKLVISTGWFHRVALNTGCNIIAWINR